MFFLEYHYNSVVLQGFIDELQEAVKSEMEYPTKMGLFSKAMLCWCCFEAEVFFLMVVF